MKSDKELSYQEEDILIETGMEKIREKRQG